MRGAVRVVAGQAVLLDRRVREDERSALVGVARQALLVDRFIAQHHRAMRAVRIVAIRALDLVLDDRVVRRLHGRRTDLLVACAADVRFVRPEGRLERRDGRVARPRRGCCGSSRTRRRPAHACPIPRRRVGDSPSGRRGRPLVFSAAVPDLIRLAGLLLAGSFRCSVASPWQAWHMLPLASFFAPCAVMAIEVMRLLVAASADRGALGSAGGFSCAMRPEKRQAPTLRRARWQAWQIASESLPGYRAGSGSANPAFASDANAARSASAPPRPRDVRRGNHQELRREALSHDKTISRDRGQVSATARAHFAVVAAHLATPRNRGRAS